MTPSEDELLHLLEQIRSDFDRARFECEPISVMLVHRATNAEAEGVKGYPKAQREPIAYGGAGHREAVQLVDEKGNPKFRADPILDVHGNPIVNSAGDAFDVVMPAFRQVQFSGEVSDYHKLNTLAERAGRVVLNISNLPIFACLLGWQFSEPADFWWSLVFEIAWSGRHPMISAQRRIWAPSEKPTSFFPYDLEQLRRLSDGILGLEKSIPQNWLKRLPEAFVSQIENIAAASFDAADYLLLEYKRQRSGPTPAPSTPRPEAVVATIGAVIRRRFAVALSFPGERRDIVEATANMLADVFGQSRVLYDRYHEAELCRPDLDLLLQGLYGDESDLVVVFVCGEYVKKEWCGIEWRAIRELMKIRSRTDADVMFLRLDNKPLAGLLSLDGFVDISTRSSRQVTDLILKRWAMSR
jgi:hypothetical protein